MKVVAADRLTLGSGEVFVESAGSMTVQVAGREASSRGGRFVVRGGEKPSVAVVVGEVKVTGLDQPLTAGQQFTEHSGKATTAPRAAHLLAWLEEPLTAALHPFVPASVHAGGSLTGFMDYFGPAEPSGVLPLQGLRLKPICGTSSGTANPLHADLRSHRRQPGMGSS
jgi:hypothetical protein